MPEYVIIVCPLSNFYPAINENFDFALIGIMFFLLPSRVNCSNWCNVWRAPLRTLFAVLSPITYSHRVCMSKVLYYSSWDVVGCWKLFEYQDQAFPLECHTKSLPEGINMIIVWSFVSFQISPLLYVPNLSLLGLVLVNQIWFSSPWKCCISGST